MAKDGLFGIIRRDGTYLVEPQFDRIYSFEGEDITVVAKDGMFGYLRRDGTMLTDLVFDNAYFSATASVWYIRTICTDM